MRILLITLTLLLSLNIFGQESAKVDQIELIKDLQIWNKEDGKMKFSFWIPNGYWRIALEGNPQVTEETITKIESLFQDYILVFMADIKIHTGGTMSYTDKKDLKKGVSLVDENGKTYLPLSDKETSSETLTILKGMSPMFAKMLGQMGEGMHFFLFKVKDKKNENIINEYQEGYFIVKHSNKEFKWTLPLPSLLPNKYCPIDNQEMKGSWSFCPFHGEKLNN